jgi:hypothetical protein
MEARPIAAALPIPPVPPVINTVLPVIEGVTAIVSRAKNGICVDTVAAKL